MFRRSLRMPPHGRWIAVVGAMAGISGCLGSVSDYAFPDLLPMKGPVKVVGTFQTDARGCGSWSPNAVDEKIIRPAIYTELKRLGASAAANVTVQEKWYDVPLTLLIVPAAFGCSNWTISGEALALDRR